MTREGYLSSFFCVLAILTLPHDALAQRRLGTEFQVNTYTTGSQIYAQVATDADGDFVVAWQSTGQDGYGAGVFARSFSSTGAPLTGELQVNSFTFNNQYSPALAASASGDFVVAWASEGQDGSEYGIFAHRFSSAGAPLATEFQVNTYTASYQRNPSVAANASGEFVVTWNSTAQDGSGEGVFGRRFSSAGTPLATEFLVNTHTANHQYASWVAASTSGDFVVAWTSLEQDGSDFGVFARRFSSAGAALASEFQVNSHTAQSQFLPSIAASASGDFVVAWPSYEQDGSDYGVFARRFSSAGAALASEFQVNTATSGYQSNLWVAAESDGDFVVVWTSYQQDGSVDGVFARRFSSAGVTLATEFRVNTYTPSFQSTPSVATQGDGDFVVAWQSNLQDKSGYGVFGQRFAAPSVLDVDGNGTIGPLTDGLLVLRLFFGFTGTTLTNAAVGNGCTRCDAESIEAYVGGFGLALDIDGDGAILPLTDGLLILRYMFGFTGATLTNGATDGDCSRCDAAAIEPYLAGLT